MSILHFFVLFLMTFRFHVAYTFSGRGTECGNYRVALFRRQCRSYAQKYKSDQQPSDLSTLSKEQVNKLPRLYVKSRLAIDNTVQFSEEDVNYVKNVMRMQNGEPLRLFNEQDGEVLATISAVKEKRSYEVSAKVISSLRSKPSNETQQIGLLFAPIKRDRMKILLEKATELGVSHFQPIITQNTNSEMDKVESLEKIVIQSVEQSERLTVPSLLPPLSFSSLLSQLPSMSSKGPVYLCKERDSSIPTLYEALGGESTLSQKCVYAIIGPEGGFTASECAQLEQFCTAVSLGSNVLRAETAGIAALSLITTRLLNR